MGHVSESMQDAGKILYERANDERLWRRRCREFGYLLAESLSGQGGRLAPNLFRSVAKAEVEAFLDSLGMDGLCKSSLHRFLDGEFTSISPINRPRLMERQFADFVWVADVFETMRVKGMAPDLGEDLAVAEISPDPEPIAVDRPRRGRPKGSKNKPKAAPPLELNKEYL